ncbi:YdcF family protein [Prosthecomicrobium pneumaticum]|uniref:Uncharacterized SAM-binding protein YcdF (DUF218 family) n=1 Tax=Prosthecomicrobium pneumaticum TaxID=81895 RepID=A0A7W9FP33_9HYPH|nr:YdcF family protein [Prosthecomicrobium pneumaticum]MBB5754173.1 uncharacterized SAM-binding protein YcdF (DUF218 family) [Prosthecomicrobium pneumaticum]
MFFYASKLVWIAAQPSTLLLLLLLVGLVLLLAGRRRAGTRVVAAATLCLMVAGYGPVGALLFSPLEERFPRPALDAPVAGIIVLGGAVDPRVGAARGAVSLSESAERMTEAVTLSRRHPEAQIVFTGGSAALFPDGLTEAQAALRFFEAMGVPAERIIVEDKSRNTAENAAFTRALIAPGPGGRWLLVTSAFHMPRAIGCFRVAGFPVVPWPVDYQFAGPDDVWRIGTSLPGGLGRLDQAVREWLGLVAYRLTGRTDALFPAPDQAAGGPSL